MDFKCKNCVRCLSNNLYFLFQINKDSDSFMAGNSTLNDPYSDMELEYNEALLETILAAGNSASNKRNSSKRLVNAYSWKMFKRNI